MSATATTLYALIVLANGNFNVTRDFPTKSECQQQFRGGNGGCMPYDPDDKRWTMFFRPLSSVKLVRKIVNQVECEDYRNALKPEIPSKCEQIVWPDDCNWPAVSAVTAPSNTLGLNKDGAPLQLPKHYSFADVQVGPNDLQAKDRPAITPLEKPQPIVAPRVTVTQRTGPQYYSREPEPLQALIDIFMAPIDFAAYPGRRDW